ncbi:MAG TPA: CARDB domain-containing protein [Candidatus Binatia bacterium]|jgi:pectate lyase|nr:CARDB domain-containing protein [Candidatus Binatia bacterium]
MSSQRTFACPVLSFFAPQLRLLAKLGGRAALCCVLVGALGRPPQAAAEDYSTPDYYVSADVKPYTTAGPITVVYSSSNLSDVSAAATVVEFSVARQSTPAQKSVLGRASVPALARWASVTKTASFPLPGGLPVGTNEMKIFCNINPSHGNGEVKTANNLTTNSFEAVVTTASAAAAMPDLTVTALSAPASAKAGAAISVSDTLRNMGGKNAGGFTSSYYLKGPAGQKTLMNRTTAGLPAKSSSLESFKVTVPAGLQTGTYTLTARVNSTGSVSESNTANNTAARSLAVTGSSPPPPPPPVNTSLVGFGSATPGGAGKPVYTVTTLADSGPGSLRQAVSQGNRYIKFAVAGTITLTDPIETKGPFLTIDGLSAPAPGITLSGAGLYLMGYSSEWGFDNHSHDIIVRGLRIRDAAEDAFRIAYNAYNIVLDHVSAQGAGDGNIDVTEGSHDVTVSWSIFADPVDQLNSLLAYRAQHISMHHNLFVASSDRNPFMGYDYEGAVSSALNLEFWNNLVWDWGGGSGTRVTYGSKANMVNNYFYSPGGDNEDALVVCSSSVPAAHEGDCEHYDPVFFARAYVKGNVDPELASINAVGAGAVTAPFPGGSVITQNACTAAAKVLSSAGAVPRDSRDKAYVSSITLQPGLCP